VLSRLDFGSVNGRIGLLFMIGAFCFAVASIPAIAEPLGPLPVAIVYFLGSIFFTSAALFQLWSSRDRLDRLASAIQLAGTVFFNVNTFAAVVDAVEPIRPDLLIWAPDAYGSACFLVSSAIAQFVALRDVNRGVGWAAVNRRRDDWPRLRERIGHALGNRWHEATRDLHSDEIWIAYFNLAGSVAFGISAIASFVVPDTGEAINAAAVSTWTLLGAIGFFVAAFLLVEERRAGSGEPAAA
jgi:hypothetical protein